MTTKRTKRARRSHRREFTKTQLLARANRTERWIKRTEKSIADQSIRIAYFRLLAREQSEKITQMRGDLRGAKRDAASLRKRANATK